MQRKCYCRGSALQFDPAPSYISDMARDQAPDNGPHRPRVEPEIIPPERNAPREGIWMRVDEEGVQRIYIARPGRSSIIFGLLILGAILAVAFVVVAGVLLLWLPILIGGIVLALVAGAIRFRWWRLRQWWAGRR